MQEADVRSERRPALLLHGSSKHQDMVNLNLNTNEGRMDV